MSSRPLGLAAACPPRPRKPRAPSSASAFFAAGETSWDEVGNNSKVKSNGRSGRGGGEGQDGGGFELRILGGEHRILAVVGVVGNHGLQPNEAAVLAL